VVSLAALYALIVFFTYNEVTTPPFGYPKYYVPALGPALLVVLAPLAFLDVARLRRHTLSLLSGAVGGMALLGLVAIGYLEYARRHLLSTFPARPWWFLLLAGIAVLAGLLGLVFRNVRAPRELATVAVFAAVILLGAIDVSEALYQRSQPESVRYFPGERDEQVTIDKIRDLTLSQRAEKDAVLISGKDIGFEAGVRYYEDDLYLANVSSFAGLVRRHPGIWLVTRSMYDYSQIVYPRTFALLPRLARRVWVSPSGDFTIWRAKMSGVRSPSP
jgi:hypothetical protein